MNGWTALHWATKSGDPNAVKYLLEQGANATIQNSKGQTPIDLATNDAIRKLFGMEPVKPDTGTNVLGTEGPKLYGLLPLMRPEELVSQQADDGLGPSHLEQSQVVGKKVEQSHIEGENVGQSQIEGENVELLKTSKVLKVKTKGAEDFIELELKEETFESLVKEIRQEFELNSNTNINKIRKLPNTLIRKDRDVQRLEEYQELEFEYHRN